MSDFCDGKLVDVSTRDNVGGRPFRIRVSAPGVGQPTVFSGTNGTLQFNGAFWSSSNSWAVNLNGALSSYTGTSISWIGHVGTLACHRETAAHNRARGFDLCGIRLSNGQTIDMNASPTLGTAERLRYIAVAASLRRFFGTVLTTWYNSAHRDHIHFDDLTAYAPIRSSMQSDTTLIQAICREFVDPGVAVDGVWGPHTEQAYRQLLIEFRLLCHHPRGAGAPASTLLHYIVANGLAGQVTHRYPTTPGPFADVGDCHPFFAEIGWMYTSNTSLGYPNPYGTAPLYRPFDDVARQGIAAFLYRIAGEPAVSSTAHFSDVPSGHPFFDPIQWLWESGASEGYPAPPGKPQFRPVGTMSRQAMAAFLYRLAGEPAVSGTPHFGDIATAHQFFEAIQWMFESGTSKGTPVPGGKPNYLPADAVSRAAMAAFLQRLYA